MSILFKCPCGRSMVVESDRSGEVVQCPNCKRSLKVPSGKDRGVELPPVPAAAKATSSRACPRCQKSIPVDAQMCPHCKGIIMDQPATAGAPAAAAASRPGTASRPGMRQPSNPNAIRYGGHSGSWWEHSTSQQKGMFFGIVGGVVLLVLVISLVIYFVYGSAVARDEYALGQQALEEGIRNELVANFQEAHDQYAVFTRIEILRNSGNSESIQLADALERRVNAMAYLAPSTQIARDESVYWKPKDAAELQRERSNLQANYGNYRTQAVALTTLVFDTAKAAKGNKSADKIAFQGKVKQVLDAFVNLVATTPIQQHSTLTFQQLLEVMKAFTDANKNWDNVATRDRRLTDAYMYAEAARERIQMTSPFGDNFWER
jgi:hypothetical protein